MADTEAEEVLRQSLILYKSMLGLQQKRIEERVQGFDDDTEVWFSISEPVMSEAELGDGEFRWLYTAMLGGPFLDGGSARDSADRFALDSGRAQVLGPVKVRFIRERRGVGR